MWRNTKVTQHLGIDVPIVLGPFGANLSSEDLVVIVSEAGGLGIFGANALTPAQIIEVSAKLRSRTAKPFGLNLWIPTSDQPLSEPVAFEKAAVHLRPFFDEFGLAIPAPPTRFSEAYEEQIEALLEARPAVFSFVFGAPSPAVLAECRKRGIATIGTATSVPEAEHLDAAGVDMIVVTGFEAGGHRPSFLKPSEESLHGLLTLVPRTADRVGKPLIAAGGIADGRGIAAALTLGASAVQIGTAFLACVESMIDPAYRAALRGPQGEVTCLTRAFSGRLARAIPNRFIWEMAGAAGDIAPYPVQSWLTNKLRNAARDRGCFDMQNWWAGQGAPLLKHDRAADLFLALVNETDALLARTNQYVLGGHIA